MKTAAHKALYCMLAKARKLQLPIDIQCQLFDHLVLPVLLYGIEVWGYEDVLQVEVFHRKFLRLILHVNRYTADNAGRLEMYFVQRGEVGDE